MIAASRQYQPITWCRNMIGSGVDCVEASFEESAFFARLQTASSCFDGQETNNHRRKAGSMIDAVHTNRYGLRDYLCVFAVMLLLICSILHKTYD